MELGHTLASLREGGKLEAKSAQGGLPRSIWETYSAFANTDGGAVLLGVEENERAELVPVGVTDSDALIKVLWDNLNNPGCVSVNLLCETDVSIGQEGGASYVVVNVPRAPRQDRPVYIRGNLATGTYRRNGEGDYRCSMEEVKTLLRDAADGTDRAILEEIDLDALCDETVAAFRDAFKSLRPAHPWARLPQNDLLLRLGAIGRGTTTHELHPTRAGLLMFGHAYEITREYPNYFLDYRRRLGARCWDNRITSSDGTWSGNVYDFWRKVAPRLVDSLPQPFALAPDMRRLNETPMHIALREGLANMLAHADYYGRRGCVVLHEPDSVTFSNPGGLRMPCEVAIQGGHSDPRNTTLMTMFNLAGITERAGSGFDVMRAACMWAGLPQPSLREEFGPDRTVLRFSLDDADGRVPNARTYGDAHTGAAGWTATEPARYEEVEIPTRGRIHNAGTSFGETSVERILARWDEQGFGRSLRDTSRTAQGSHRSQQLPPATNDYLEAQASRMEIRVTQHRRRRPLREQREIVMHFVIENGEIRRADAQELLDVGSTKAKQLLCDMVREGMLVVEGAGPATRYLMASA